MSRKAYIFTYNDEVGSREELMEYIDGVPEILNWRFDMQHAFYLVSELDAEQLASKIREYSGRKGRFLVAEIDRNKQGWLPRGTWRFLNRKHVPNEHAEPEAAGEPAA